MADMSARGKLAIIMSYRVVSIFSDFMSSPVILFNVLSFTNIELIYRHLICFLHSSREIAGTWWNMSYGTGKSIDAKNCSLFERNRWNADCHLDYCECLLMITTADILEIFCFNIAKRRNISMLNLDNIKILYYKIYDFCTRGKEIMKLNVNYFKVSFRRPRII